MKYRQKIALIVGIVCMVQIVVVPVAAKTLPQSRKLVGKPAAKPVGGGSGKVGIGARLRGDRKALILSFSNLAAASNVSYTLMYQTNGKEEGVNGSVDSSTGASTSREIFFGTCSSGTCREHTGLSNMKLEITTQLNSGKTTVKRYKIKI